MPFKKFRLGVVWRVLLCLGAFISATFFLFQTDYWLVSVWLYLAFGLSIFTLLRFIEKAHRDLYYFLLSIKEGDFSSNYPYQHKEELNYAFDTINSVLNKLRNDKASNLVYLQTVVEHIGIPLICLEERKIVLHNKASKKLLGIENLKSTAQLGRLNKELANSALSLNHGEQQLLKVSLNGKSYSLSIRATAFKLQRVSFKLVSIQDIRAELEANELASWQKLIRVLTHEIKNSAIPISTLSEVIFDLVKQHTDEFKALKADETLEDILGGLATIQSRSSGLVAFVNTYDRLAKLPQPKLAPTSLVDLFESMKTLFEAEFIQKNISFTVKMDSHLTLAIDESLIAQVLINLIKNAIEVLESQGGPHIQVSVLQNESVTEVVVKDNGPGIPEEVIEQIFVPFFSTKNRGSGIGLSLSRQIMKAHNGSLSVETDSFGSSFTLSFPQ